MSSQKWGNFLRNTGWYFVTLFVLFIAIRLMPPTFILMWLVALTWGAFLIYRFYRLLTIPYEQEIVEEHLEAYLLQAQGYQEQINNLLNDSSLINRNDLEQLAKQIPTWVQAIEDLVKRINYLSQISLIKRDIERVPQAIAQLETRISKAQDPVLRKHLTRTLLNHKKQLLSLQTLQKNLQQAEAQIEHTLSTLDTLSSELLAGSSINDVATYIHLAANVDEEVRRIENHLEALSEIKLKQ